jgi:hypothetical protein
VDEAEFHAGTWTAAVPRSWRTASWLANIPFLPAADHVVFGSDFPPAGVAVIEVNPESLHSSSSNTRTADQVTNFQGQCADPLPPLGPAAGRPVMSSVVYADHLTNYAARLTIWAA